MIYLQVHELFTEIYHESMFLLEKGLFLDTFYFYLDLQLLYSEAMFIFSSKTHYKVNCAQFCHLISEVILSFGTNEKYCLILESL